jgi:hypothetical protein
MNCGRFSPKKGRRRARQILITDGAMSLRRQRDELTTTCREALFLVSRRGFV